MEIAEFLGQTERDVYPFTTFINHLFIYPLALNFDSQKLFSRARNIAILIELRDTDAEGSKSIPVSLFGSVRWLINYKHFFSAFMDVQHRNQYFYHKYHVPYYIIVQHHHGMKK